ncbi:IS4 family transposase [Xanthomonas translucens]|uniref:IS4 family transposase n=1 Tax=Xanthomonas campestris pv. translucens TaxID=343 RepID=UPI0002A78960|nr:IS4 family transposase [Xanthomonas translucens]ELQ01989.1 transposase [Xanthomonas translucens DAR61454]MBC3972068.1 IS4 family transposase [Xanthomonas translucens pv. undulosa]MCT8281067.1 IS4 family transposase [Xanthomonas translucens pv. undulosa]MCT8315879.1 IS4 family transposase [Xanthomonas translucens pv. undulosa]QSQ57703.1 IS4 family transposase [Xanthomonas translucens pv. undulosa]
MRYKHGQAQRYVVRAQSDRGLAQGGQPLFGGLSGEQRWQYEATVEVTQRGGRAARKARVQVCGRRLEVKPPADRGKQAVSLPVNVVLVREPAGSEHEPLNWVLLTSEPVETVKQVKQIVGYYELRWRIEEYHKAWKSGVGVERLRQHSAQNLERMQVITAFVAVRLLQLREQLPSRADKEEVQAALPCDQILGAEEWRVLWLTVKKTAPPLTPPTARWACLAVARLGGFTDTKRTGRPGWDTLWHGWQVLQERVAGFRLATGMTALM